MAKRNHNSLMNQIMEKIMEYEGHIYFVTLTLKDDSVLNKNTIRDFIIKVKYRDVQIDGYFWVKELQKRGVVHYHMLILTPQKIRDMYDKVNESWGYGWVFVKGVERQKVRNAMLYIMKYVKKDLNEQVKNEKMKRKIGRGGILKFRAETFLSRVVRFSEFEYVGSANTKGMRLKVYRCMGMVMFVSSSMYGTRFDIFECDIEKIIYTFKYEMKNANKIGSLLNNLKYLLLSRLEREDILGYHKFDKEINKLLWKLGI